MRFAVDSWQADYGSATEAGALAPSEVETEIDVEVPVAQWAPRSPAGVGAAPVVLFVDGVRRVEARVWITEPDGVLHLGLAASYAAGVVLCNSRARVVAADVERRLFTAAPSAEAIDTRYGRFDVSATTKRTPEELSLDIQHNMGDLEARLARRASAEAAGGNGHAGALVVVDGPLRTRCHERGTVGSIKTQHLSYGPPIVQQTIGALAAGERTPLFVVGGAFPRWSWYVRLPGPVPHPLASVVRCEVDRDVAREEVITLADTVTATLPRYASSPAKDARAPQNLYPIGGLEADLRHRLGDAQLMLRGLALAAHPV
jgi:hypothetical protein